MRYDICILGNHQSTRALIESLIDDKLKPDLVVTLGKSALEKASIANVAEDFAGWCRQRSINVYECDGYRLTSNSDKSFFSNNSFGIGVCTDWQHLLPGTVLNAFAHGVFGFHGSLMAFPNGRGRSPFNWSLRLGGKSIFHNCFRYTEGADDGGVFNTTEIPVGLNEPIRTVQFKAMVDSRVTIKKLLTAYRSGEIRVVPQPVAASVWLPKLSPADSCLHFEANDMQDILNIVRASSHPFAGAYGLTKTGEQIVIWRATEYDGPIDPKWADAPTGSILVGAMDSALIKCRDGLMLATELSVEAETLSGQVFG